MNRTLAKKTINLLATQRQELVKVMGNPLDDHVDEATIQKPFMVLQQPMNQPKQTVAKAITKRRRTTTTTTTTTINHPTEENYIVCAWLTCSCCGYQTLDTANFEEHVQVHKNELINESLVVQDAGNKMVIETLENSIEEDKEFYEPELQTEILLPKTPLNVKDPVGISGILRLMQYEKPQKNPKPQRTGHLIAPNFVPIDIFNSKPYTCNRCNHRTSTLKKLDEHMRIHTGERPFVCKTCGYATRNASALSYHLKTHKENRPFTCNLCNYRNTTLSSLRSHKTRIHLYQPSTSVLFQ